MWVAANGLPVSVQVLVRLGYILDRVLEFLVLMPKHEKGAAVDFHVTGLTYGL